MPHCSLPALFLSALLGVCPTANAVLAKTETSASRQCLQRVAGLPKAAGYNALCGSVDALYKEQRQIAHSFSNLQQENGELRSSLKTLQQEHALLQAEVQK